MQISYYKKLNLLFIMEYIFIVIIMDNYVLKIINYDELLIYNKFLFGNYYHNLYNFTSNTKNLILYMPFDKATFGHLCCHTDNKIIYYLSYETHKNDWVFEGLNYDNFVNKNYKVIKLEYVYEECNLGEFFTIYNTLNTDIQIKNNIYTSIITQLQTTYILLKQIIDFKDINQYILKMYANIIL